jgi:hypothetical protein
MLDNSISFFYTKPKILVVYHWQFFVSLTKSKPLCQLKRHILNLVQVILLTCTC